MSDLKEFSKTLEPIGRKYDLAKVFNDLLTMSICAFHRTNIQSQLREKDAANEALYMDTIRPYDGEYLKSFSKAMSILQLNVLDNPYSDLLGEFFTIYISKGQNGQYFTPEPICEFMAMINGLDVEKEGQRILDPACGSGRMLLSAAKLNHQNYFYGADNTHTCAKMTAINFFLNGLNGEVAWMNSLSMEWYGGWKINHNGVGIFPIEKEQSSIWNEAPKKEPDEFKKGSKSPGIPAEQLTLF